LAEVFLEKLSFWVKKFYLSITFMTREIRIGIDIGGTFTDFVVYDPEAESLYSFKLPSTSENPALAVIEGVKSIISMLPYDVTGKIVHGSTVATNALLERKGARTALITTRGFKDILQIGRQNRPALYDFFVDPPPSLVPNDLRLEIDERVGSDGKVLRSINFDQVEEISQKLISLQAESIAVCLLFSFLHPDHEKIIGQQLRKAGFNTSLSSEILPEYREYERASTTTVNAYVTPVLDRYLKYLESRFSSEQNVFDNGPVRLGLRVMQSNGGQISIQEARRQAVRCILSGPAGGIVGALCTGKLANKMQPSENDRTKDSLTNPLRLITFDMGGTSTDVSLIDGNPMVTTESIVGGCPIRIPVLDIHTIGAGGGSIAYVDPGGVLQVGPESAGADPGPASYGSSLLPTVTDANLVLGRLTLDYFLGGKMVLRPERSYKAFEELGNKIGLTAQEAALGVVEIVNAHMERALRLISVERGHDAGRASKNPFTLLSFGGAGGLHCAELAHRLDIPYVISPAFASTLSAFGMLSADIVKDYLQTVMLPGDTPLPQLENALEQFVRIGQEDVLAEGALPETVLVERQLDMRYKGQSYELTIPFSMDIIKSFNQAHRKAYGYSRDEAPLEIVNLRVRAVGQVDDPILKTEPLESNDPTTAFQEKRKVTVSSSRTIMVPIYRKELLKPGNTLEGPAIIAGVDTTIWIPEGDRGSIDRYRNLHLDIY
jgi:N-methylhydantoinase A